MYVHLPLSSPFFFFNFVYCFGEMCWWDSQSAPCVVLLSEVPRNVSVILPTARSEFFAVHFASSGKFLTAESATTMGKCWLEQPEFSWLKAVLNYEFEAQIGHIWYLKVSSEVTLSHTFVHLCHQFPFQVHPVLLDPNSVPSRSHETIKPSLVQLRCWKQRCFGFWTPCHMHQGYYS